MLKTFWAKVGIMAIQDFTAGQVLTAAQMDSLQANDYNQTVSTKTADYTLVAADKGTRVVMNSASATTITVDTSVFSDGDTLFIQNISNGDCTITAGTATVSTNGTLVLGEYDSGILYFTSTGVAIWFGDNAPNISYTPVMGVWTLGNGTLTGNYVKIGKFVSATFLFTAGSTSVFTASQPTFSLPFAIKNAANINGTFGIQLFDLSANNRYMTFAYNASTTTVGVLASDTSFTYGPQAPLGISDTRPFTWATGDKISGQYNYTAA